MVSSRRCKFLLEQSLTPVYRRALTCVMKQTFSRRALQDLKHLYTLLRYAVNDAEIGKDLTFAFNQISQRLQQSIQPNVLGKVSCNYVGAGNLVNGPYDDPRLRRAKDEMSKIGKPRLGQRLQQMEFYASLSSLAARSTSLATTT